MEWEKIWCGADNATACAQWAHLVDQMSSTNNPSRVSVFKEETPAQWFSLLSASRFSVYREGVKQWLRMFGDLDTGDLLVVGKMSETDEVGVSHTNLSRHQLRLRSGPGVQNGLERLDRYNNSWQRHKLWRQH